MNTIPFNHKMGAHCESGTVTSLLNHAGLDITEPMVFGIASGIFFGYFHRHKSFTFPTFIVRNKPGAIRRNIQKQLRIQYHTQSFRDAGKGMHALDALLEKQIPVAAQVDFFYMDYVPSWERVHINVHFMIVFGKEGSIYRISDSYFPKTVDLQEESLRRGRFAGGNMSPRGFLFYPLKMPSDIDLSKPIHNGIRKACRNMLDLPVPFIGIKGIRLFAKRIEQWPSFARDTDHLSHEIMKINILLEDQGTGGAGFRFMYATFLQQAGELLNKPALRELSEELMVIGDGWREISLFAARIGKQRQFGPENMKQLSMLLTERANLEEAFFTKLKKDDQIMTHMTSAELSELKREIKQLILDTLSITDIQPEDIENDKPLFGGTNKLTLDSVDGIEIIMAIQRQFQVRLNDQNLARHIIQSIDSIAEFIQNEKGKA